MKQVIVIVAVVCVLGLAVKALQINEASAAAYRAQQSEQPVVLGHRIGPNGQEMLVYK